MINVEQLKRSGIAKELLVISSYNPKVISIDLQFSERTEYNEDLALINALWKCKKLVMSSSIEDYDGENKTYLFTYGCLPEFVPPHAKTGFVNTILEKDDFSTMKRFPVSEIVEGRKEYHFTVQTAMEFDSQKTLSFIAKNQKIVDIDYKNGKRKFKTFSVRQVLKNEVKRSDIEGKIVMIGFLGPGDEDKFFTPLNNHVRPYSPDKYGIECWSNAIAQILESK